MNFALSKDDAARLNVEGTLTTMKWVCDEQGNWRHAPYELTVTDKGRSDRPVAQAIRSRSNG